jgi:hypothetical protein
MKSGNTRKSIEMFYKRLLRWCKDMKSEKPAFYGTQNTGMVDFALSPQPSANLRLGIRPHGYTPQFDHADELPSHPGSLLKVGKVLRNLGSYQPDCTVSHGRQHNPNDTVLFTIYLNVCNNG